MFYLKYCCATDISNEKYFTQQQRYLPLQHATSNNYNEKEISACKKKLHDQIYNVELQQQIDCHIRIVSSDIKRNKH